MTGRIALTMMALMSLLWAGIASAQETAPRPATTAAAYRLGVDDKVRLVVYGEEQLSGEYVIGSEGAISLPLVGPIEIEGLTVPQAQAKITKAYGSSYVADPKVSLDIVEYRPFYILGEVNKAGQYPYRIGMTVLRAVATAEGFTYRANQKRVAIQGSDGVERIVALTSQTPVQPGDTIRILERYF